MTNTLRLRKESQRMSPCFVVLSRYLHRLIRKVIDIPTPISPYILKKSIKILCDESTIIFGGKYASISPARSKLKSRMIASGPSQKMIQERLSKPPMSVCFMRMNLELRESHFSVP